MPHPSPSPRIFLLSGCASGLGRHLTGALLRRGHRVTATDVARDALEEAAEKEGWNRDSVLLEGLDVTRPEDWDGVVEATLDRFSRLDVAINNAGYLRPGYLLEAEAEEVERHLAVNTRGVILGTRAAARAMAKHGEGHIINIASLAGVAAIPGISLYSASKFAVRGFSLAVAEELRPHGVAVTVVCPDAIRTPMLDLQKDYEEANLTFSAPRFLSLEDMERLVLGRVLRDRPLECLVPRSRGFTAKVASALPSLAAPLAGWLTKLGDKKRRAFVPGPPSTDR